MHGCELRSISYYSLQVDLANNCCTKPASKVETCQVKAPSPMEMVELTQVPQLSSEADSSGCMLRVPTYKLMVSHY